MAYRGIVATLPVGLTGFNGSRNASKLAPGDFSFCEGTDVDGQVLIKDGGATKLNSSALGAPSKVLAGTNWSPSVGSDHDIVVLGNGQIRKDTGAGTWPTLLNTISAPSVFPPFFVRAGGESLGSTRKLFIFTESAQVQMLSGTNNTCAAITTPPADWASSFPIGGVQHANRLWGFGNGSDPHRIYYSTTGNHQDFTGSGSGTFSVYPGEGEQIVAALSFRGLLIVAKYPNGLYVIDTRDPDFTLWRVDKLNSAVGACSPWCMLQISNDILLLDNGGNFHIMSAVTDFSDISTSDVGRAQNLGPFMRANVSLTAMRKAMGMWYAAKSKAWFMVPLLGSVDNNLRIVIDFNDATAGPRFYLSRRDIACSLWSRPDVSKVRRPTTGDDVGFVRTMDTETRNKDGALYRMEFDTAEMDFSSVDPQLSGHVKNGQYLEITADLVRNTMIQVTPTWDGFIGTPFFVIVGSLGAALDNFVLDTDALSASGTVTTHDRLVGSGRRLKLSMLNTVLDDEVRISEIRVGFTVSDERIRSA